MRTVRCARVLAVAATCLVACIEPQLVPCGDKLCPSGMTCVGGERCASGDQISACEGVAEGQTCSVGGGVGRCDRGVCVATGCGNSVLDPGEACDDANQASGDGCSADCRKVEMCGDAVVDDGEGCDDGNANAADGCDACAPTMWRATAVIGGNASATSVGLVPSKVAADRRGNLYIADRNNHRIRRVDAATRVITTVAGTGTRGDGGDGGAATSAQLAVPFGVAVDGLGNVYVADTGNARVRCVDAMTGVITTVAGTGSSGFGGDGGGATSAQLRFPTSVTVDGLGNLYIADTDNDRIRRVDPTTGIITTVVGTGTAGFAGDGGAATSAQIDSPFDVTVDDLGTLYVADSANHRVRRVDATTGVITTVAGFGPLGFSGDGGAATSAQLSVPDGVAVDGNGTLYIADTFNHRIRRVDPTTGIITTMAGTGVQSFGGDGGAATSAQLGVPLGVAVDGVGTLYIADLDNHRIRRVDAMTGIITTMAGTGALGVTGDGGAPTGAALDQPHGMAFDSLGNLYIADTDNFRIRRIDATTGVITTVAGNGTYGAGGDGGVAISAQLGRPYGVAVDALGTLYVADSFNNRVRRVDATTGVITTVAGNGIAGFAGDGGAATSAQLYHPLDVAVDGAGTLYIADADNHRVRRVDATTGIITTAAGTGTSGFSGDGGPAASAQIGSPYGLFLDGLGMLYVADPGDSRIRRIDATTGIITTVAGNGTRGFAGDGGAATSAQLGFATKVAVDGTGNLYIADYDNNRVRRVDAMTGLITTVAGNGFRGTNGFGDFSGDGASAVGAHLNFPYDVAIDAVGRLYIADTENGCVRRVDAAGVITTAAGLVDPEGVGPFPQARLADARAVVVSPPFTLVAGGSSGTLQAAPTGAAWLETVAGRYPQTSATGVLARFRDPLFGTVSGVAYDAAAGLVYLTESSSHRLHVVTVVDPADETTWTIAPLANATGTLGFADGAAQTARFREPTGLYLDAAARQLYIADTGNHVVRAIDLSAGVAGATVRTVAGIPQTRGFFGDGGPAAGALLYAPQAITRCGNGDLFIADTGNHRVRRVAASDGAIATVLGVGVAASSGEGRPASTFPVNAPLGLACDATGNLYVTSTTSVRLVPADASGLVDGTGAVQTIYGAPPRETFPASVTRCLTGLAVVDATTVQVADSCTGLLVELRREPRQ